MTIYLLITVLYYIAFYVAIRLLGKKNRLDIISPTLAKGDYIFEKVVISIVLGFVPIIRLVLVVAMYYICFCNKEKAEELKNRDKE